MTKTVIITGASSGVGKACAELFYRSGWNVVATARAIATLGFLPDTDQTLKLRIDVTNESSIVDAMTAAIHRFGSIDVLVNNAGIGLGGAFESITDNELRDIFSVNFFGAASAIRAVAPLMRRQRAGVIVNVTSITGRLGLPFMGSYDATKFALEGLSESLRYEFSLVGVRIKLVEPGGVKTRFAHKWIRNDAYEPILGQFIDKMTKGATEAKGPEKVAEMVFKAATDRSRKLRYTVNGSGPFIYLHRLLPDAIWRRLVASAFLA